MSEDAVCTLYKFERVTVARVCSKAQMDREMTGEPFWWEWGEEYARRYPGIGEITEIVTVELEIEP